MGRAVFDPRGQSVRRDGVSVDPAVTVPFYGGGALL